MFESDESRAEHRRVVREKRLLAARNRAARLNSGQEMSNIHVARAAASGITSPRSGQATKSTLAVLRKLSHMDDDHGPRNLSLIHI